MSTSTANRQLDRPAPRRSRAWRWVAVFVAVSVLHWGAMQWFERHHGAPPPLAPARVPVQVTLLKTERIEQQARPAAPAPVQPKPAAPVRPKRATSPPHTLHAITPPAPHPETAAAPEAPQAGPDTESASASTANSASGATAASGNGNNPAAQTDQASHGLKFSVPPSGELQYDTFFNGARNQPGTIHWKSDGKRYEIVVAVPLPFVGTFSWTSRGHVDAFGLAPEQYIEKRGSRPENFTIFNREEKQIVFTRTPNSLALPDGAQDRFSMVMQLASLVRGDPDAYKPGVTREFYVADNNSGETWPIATIGDETVSTDHGMVTARHFMRLPRREGDKRRIDVWLAPALGWLPVRLVQTEPNGTQIELLWRGALSVPPANEAANGTASGTSSATADDAKPDTPASAATSPVVTDEAAPATTNGGTPGAASPSAAPAFAAPAEAQPMQPAAQPAVQDTTPLPPADAPMHP
ncbi:hypothetical protein LMG28688_01814 [Paraburkholderia caffeinitolerans]|uniref:DUF3108 domain-containing protein n=1 Tax=Paraburkholderia caffeinitolerans TaxID=1723730 RepID=A0A6J5FRR3_9BURK|nr:MULTISPECIES: DUF3108 domain-containing protein [Paraburkholderia]CAB3784164.1 hypothetical protein LMG28688_01814 [Paraburkholderia caffeinitolerans]